MLQLLLPLPLLLRGCWSHNLIILIELSNMSNAKGVLIIMNHH